MTQDDFIKSVINTPWVDRTSDCYWLVEQYYKQVMNINLPLVNGYSEAQCDVSEGWQANIHDWQEVSAPCENGLLFTCYSDGKPAHVGVVISATKALHSRGSPELHGKVEIHSIRTLERMFGKITFHKYTGPTNA